MIRVFVSKETQDKVPTQEVLNLLRSVKHPELKRMTAEALVNGPPVGDPVTVTFRSHNAEQLNKAVNHIKEFISQKDGIFDAKIDDVIGDDEVTVNVDYQKAAQLGLTLQDIGLSVRTAIAGTVLGDVNLDNRKVDYYLRFSEEDKKSLKSLESVMISDRQGNLIPLRNVATFETRTGSPQIKRFDFRRAKTVTANLDDTKTTSIEANAAIQKEFDQISSTYKDVDIVFGGEAEKTNESVGSLFTALILSVIGIFALMVLIFRSFMSPLIILTTILFSSTVSAQNKISMSAAIDSAIQNNASLKASSMQVNYYQALKKSNLDIEKTLFDFGYGKINSFQNDNRMTVTQNIQFPAVYKSQGAINKTNINISVLSKLQKEIELKAAVKSSFYNLLLVQRRKQLLLNADSIYTSFANKAKQRFEAGNSDILEKITAESQLAQISNQLELLTTEYEVLLNEFNILLNSKMVQEPFAENNIIELERIPDLLTVAETPQIKISQQRITLAENELQLEKGKLQPSFNLGYNSSTIIGWQPISQTAEQYFGKDYRFNAFNMGMSIPLFSSAQRSRIAAGSISVQQNKLEQIAVQQQLSANLKNLAARYVQNKSLIIKYQRTILPNTNLLIETASKKLNAGEIGYLEWVMIINQAIQIQNEYFNYVQQLNEGAIEIEKITANN
jgi:outer membrane protein TolC